MDFVSCISALLSLDQQWLVAINQCHAPWADVVMWVISAKWTWIPLYAVLIGCVVWRYRKYNAPAGSVVARMAKVLHVSSESGKGWIACGLVLLSFAVAVGAADYISSGVIKHAVCRLRPTHEPALEGMLHIVNGYCGGMYGFVSSHAANTMACGLLFSLIWKNRKATSGLMLWVALNCYSRMYLGVHYPLDILGGLIVGSLVAVVVYLLLRCCRLVGAASDTEVAVEAPIG